ncbi:MAG: [FeFe] hydrogenase H-cluster maturation GTPase HydF [Candidatus Omnitrophica bacterium]|nr:[FeFe] hydrogenase H-cluster maturation GTPase HydF [Candidatus Omnitrophota bacterium]
MDTTPKANRIHIALFGRTNVGKSSFLNHLVGQGISITSDIAGTTTDVVEKAMELLPLGPVLFLDTAGLGDKTELAQKRFEKTNKVFERSDVVLLVVEADVWTDYEISVVEKAKSFMIPLIVVINKSDVAYPDEKFLSLVKDHAKDIIVCNSTDDALREKDLEKLKGLLKENLPSDILQDPFLISDLVQAGQIALLVVPIDLEAPKGRLILPQVQTIRDVLDSDAVCIVSKERELLSMLDNLKQKPSIVVCDSQAVLKVAADVPMDVKMTTFSILFSRVKGDIVQMAQGAAAIDDLVAESRVLIAEACTHHAIGDDIGRVKIPRWLKAYLGFSPSIDIFAGREYPENIQDYDLIIHCGACMFNRKQMLTRLKYSKNSNIAITNYGMCISVLHGVIERTLEPFPQALIAYQNKKVKR